MIDKGFTDQVQGKVKKVVGEITGDQKTKAEGMIDQVVGKTKEAVSDTKDVIEEVAEKAKEALDKK